MCCRFNRCGCGCGCGFGCGCDRDCDRRRGCGCGCDCDRRRDCDFWDMGSGITALSVFPDRAVFEPAVSGVTSADFPVYVSMPASMTRGSANLRAAVDLDSGCPFARG